MVAFYLGGQFVSRDDTAIVLLTTICSLFAAILLLEKFFTTPTDAFLNSFTAVVLLLTSYDAFKAAGAWYIILLAYTGAILAFSTAAIMLFEWGTSRTRFLSNEIRLSVGVVGSGRHIWFILFLVCLAANYSLTGGFPTAILLFATVMVLLDRQIVIAVERILNRKKTYEDLGTIIGVQSQNVFLARLLKNRSEVKLFDSVAFRYTIGSHDVTNTGVIIDRFMLDDERWIRILQYTVQSDDDLAKISENGIIKLTKPATDFSEKFVGVVERDSRINELQFRYLAKNPILEGQILSAEVNGKELLYQIADASTDVERLEDKNDAGFIVGSAVQLGCWNADKKSFERYGWLPNMMTPVYRAKALREPAKEDETTVASIRDLGSAVNFDFDQGIKHHIAVVGVTGSGKSVFARHLMRKAVSNDVKIVCIDVTAEYEGRFCGLKVTKLRDLINFDEVAMKLTAVGEELGKFANQQRPAVIINNTSEVRISMRSALEKFVKSNSQVLLVDLPDLENTSDMLDFLRNLFVSIFMAARAGTFGDQKLLLALEEAHTLVPEHNFMSTNDRRMGGVVNAISQIALQGRKYNVGLMVMAQRTANVSKTILTQCNTIFAFQQFDKTSVDFLTSYFGEFAKALPLLSPRDMIVVGKGVGSSVPFIATVPELEEKAPPVPNAPEQAPVVIDEALPIEVEPPAIPELPREIG